MAISERERRELHAAIERELGARAADLLLAMTEPELPFVLRAEMAEVRREVADFRTDVAGRFAQVHGEFAQVHGAIGQLQREIGQLAGKIGQLDGKIERLDGKIDARFSKALVTNIGAMFGVAAAVIAAGALF